MSVGLVGAGMRQVNVYGVIREQRQSCASQQAGGVKMPSFQYG